MILAKMWAIHSDISMQISYQMETFFLRTRSLQLYFDTGYNLPNVSESKFKMLVEKHGEDKILFASDSPWCNIGTLVELLKSYNLGKEAEEKIFSRNAIKLLGM